MKPIRVFSQMMIDLGGVERLEITECFDGWNIEIKNPQNVRIGVANNQGIHFRYVNDLINLAEDKKHHD